MEDNVNHLHTINDSELDTLKHHSCRLEVKGGPRLDPWGFLNPFTLRQFSWFYEFIWREMIMTCNCLYKFKNWILFGNYKCLLKGTLAVKFGVWKSRLKDESYGFLWCVIEILAFDMKVLNYIRWSVYFIFVWNLYHMFLISCFIHICELGKKFASPIRIYWLLKFSSFLAAWNIL